MIGNKMVLNYSTKKQEIGFYFILFFFFLIIYLLIGGTLSSDMPAHAKYARQLLTGEKQTGFRDLFFWLINLFSGFSQNKVLSGLSLCFLISLASILKSYLTFQSIEGLLQKEGLKDKLSNFKISIFVSISLVFVFSIPIPNYLVNGYYFMGGFPSNVWNNSTTIFLFPFALLLFDLSFKQLSAFSVKRNIYIFILVLINILIKPSYFFVLILSYPILLFIKYKLTKTFWLAVLPLLFGASLVIFQFIDIFSGQLTVATNSSIIEVSNKSTVAFMPFSFYSEVGEIWELPFTFIFAYLFPLFYFVLHYKILKNNTLVLYTFISIFISIFIYLTLTELGPRRLHGNFQWQIIITSWICFFVFIKLLISDIIHDGWNKKNRLLFSLYSIHVLSGILYLIKYFVTGICY